MSGPKPRPEKRRVPTTVAILPRIKAVLSAEAERQGITVSTLSARALEAYAATIK